LKFIDFFAGIGGFRQGMTNAGHKPVGWCEIDKFAQKSYKTLYNTEGEFFNDNVRTINASSLPEAEVYTIGFPCQSFSVAGRRGGLEDTRGTLIFEVLRLAKKRKPKYLFMENVKGLLSQSGGSAFATILNAVHGVGYEYIQWQTLNTKDFGLPQSRERVFIVAYSGEKSPPEIFPIKRKTKNFIKQVANIEEDIRKRKNPQTGRIYDSRGLSPTLTKVQGGGQIPKIIENYEEVRAILTPNRLEKRQNGRRIKEVGEPMFTITKQDKHGIVSICKGDIKIRELTPLEYWRLQGFSDEDFYKAKNIGMSDSQLYKQAGNSVSIPVIEEIAKKLK
jgi:DNA (cytosine-5)-methyltransferase 1